MNKKRVLELVSLSLLLIFLSNLVSAFDLSAIDLRSGFQEVMQNFEDILTPVFEALLDTTSGEYFFAKVLLLLLLFVIIFTILKETPILGDNRVVAFIIASVVSILSVRYLPDETFITTILLPYTTVGTAIAVFLPYLIYLFFVHRSIPGTHARRAAWIVFGIVFLVLWGLREVGAGWGELLHFGGLVMVIISIIFDKQIHNIFESWGLSRAMAAIEDESKSTALQKYREAFERYNIDPTSFNRRNLKNAKKRLKELGVRIPSY